LTARPSWDACDVLVAGAGVAGSTVALLLARAGWKVVLADPLRPVPETGESLAAEARLLLHTLGLWDLFLRTQPLPILSKRGHWGTHSFEQSGIYSPYGLGWIVRKGKLLAELRGGARAAGAATAFGWSVVDAAPDGAGFGVRLAGADGMTYTVRAARLVDATGQRSCVAKRLGARRDVSAPLAAALWHSAPAGAAAPAEPVTIQVGSCPQGWWYAAPLPAGGMALTGYHAPPGGRAGPPDWDGVTHAALSALGGTARWQGAPLRLSAASGRLDQAAGRHWAAVGDAACSFDPLASAGLLQALRGAARVAAALSLDADRQDEHLQAYAGQVQALFAQFTARRAMIYADMFAGEGGLAAA
jgi:2-polyprenyl-6-methoxyphenol hydroxylase-like FAD-dependent oxidoreductase